MLPLWGAPRPAWIPDHGGRQWAVIALLDYGPDPIPFFTQAHRVPLGVNMAFRREAFDRAGLWDNERRTQEGDAARAGSPRVDGPRARRGAAGLVRAVDGRPHVIPGRPPEQALLPALVLLERHQPRALLYRDAWIDMQAPESTEVDFSRVPHIFGVPRFFYRKAPRELRRMLRERVARRPRRELRRRVVAVVLRRRAPAAVEGSEAGRGQPPPSAPVQSPRPIGEA